MVHSVGNPGISKLWFQWYLMYSIVKRESAWLPKVVVRQIGMESLTYYFPHTEPEMAYSTTTVNPFLLKWLQPTSHHSSQKYDP